MMTGRFPAIFVLLCLISCGIDPSQGTRVFDSTHSELEQAGIAQGDSVCGNNVAGPGLCDDGNSADGDGCSAVCQLEEPPAGALGWSCPLGGAGKCFPTCGNGVVDIGNREQCDDGNVIPGDGCSPNCRFPACGDGYLDPGESCDDGSFNGLPGQCNITCDVALEWSMSAQTASLELSPIPMVAVFATDFYGQNEGGYDDADYSAKVSWLTTKEMIAGRVGQLTGRREAQETEK